MDYTTTQSLTKKNTVAADTTTRALAATPAVVLRSTSTTIAPPNGSSALRTGTAPEVSTDPAHQRQPPAYEALAIRDVRHSIAAMLGGHEYAAEGPLLAVKGDVRTDLVSEFKRRIGTPDSAADQTMALEDLIKNYQIGNKATRFAVERMMTGLAVTDQVANLRAGNPATVRDVMDRGGLLKGNRTPNDLVSSLAPPPSMTNVLLRWRLETCDTDERKVIVKELHQRFMSCGDANVMNMIGDLMASISNAGIGVAMNRNQAANLFFNGLVDRNFARSTEVWNSAVTLQLNANARGLFPSLIRRGHAGTDGFV